MKTKNNLLALLILYASMLLSRGKLKAQFYQPFGAFARYELQTQPANPFLDFTVGAVGWPVGTQGTNTLPGVGVNNASPQYMFDIECDAILGSPTNLDVNIGCANCTPIDAVAYRIGTFPNSFRVLWHNGDISSIYTGVGAGFATTGAAVTPRRNTFTGYNAGGSQYLGGHTDNTAVGYMALATTTLEQNVAIGSMALEFNPERNNTAAGFKAMGDPASTGDKNVAVGEGALLQNAGDQNVAIGWTAGGNIRTGQNDIFIGSMADETPLSNPNFATAIGNGAQVTESGQMEIGNNNAIVTMGRSGFAPAYYSNVARLELDVANGGVPFTVNCNTCAPPFYVNPGGGGNGWSGLRFDELTSGSTPGTNPNISNAVLALDGEGNVIYVYPATGGGTGFNACPGPALTINSGLQLNTFNAYFTGFGAGLQSNDVAIGYACNYTPLPAKLSVLQNSHYIPVPLSPSSIALYVENDDLQWGNTPAGQPVYGIYSFVLPSGSNNQSVAGYFNAPGGASGIPNNALIVPPSGGNVGIGTSNPPPNVTLQVVNNSNSLYTYIDIDGEAITTQPAAVIAVLGHAQNSQGSNIGVEGWANDATHPNIGVYGIGNTNSTDWAGYFDGNVFATGSVTAASFIVSDSTIKKNVKDFSNAMGIINKLKPRTFYFEGNNTYKMKFDTFMHYGFIAQEVKRVAPCMVHTIILPAKVDTSGKIITHADTLKAIDNNQVVALLTQGMQEQQQQMEELKKENEALEQKVSVLTNTVNQLLNKQK